MQERKRLLAAVETEQALEQALADLETLFELAREGERILDPYDDRRTGSRILSPARPRASHSGVSLTPNGVYALAKVSGAPVLCKGRDFPQTDIEVVTLD